ELAAADILELGGVGQRNQACADCVNLSAFDVVDASGVLHHMADPWQGWQVLLSLLRAGGFMRVGLYSKLGRAGVNAARALVKERGYSSSAEDVRRSREAILALTDGEPAKNVADDPDFFAAGECRDLLAPAQEHQMTLPEIAGF